MIAIGVLLLVAQGAATPSPLTPLQRLNARIPVDAVLEVQPHKLAGQYTSSSQELVKRMGGFLSGNDLYLFPDGTYIYCEWADIQPTTIYDRGKWTFRNGFVGLTSDAEITGNPGAERKYEVVRRRFHPAEVLLIGIKDDLEHFEEMTKGDPELNLLIVGKQRSKALNPKQARALKAKLIREDWRP